MARMIKVLAVLIFLSGCITLDKTKKFTVTIAEIDQPLLVLQKLVAHEVPIGLRATSENGQEFYSKYFIITKGTYKPAAESLDRYYAQYTILGDRRPYEIEILVTREKRVLRGNRFDYITVAHDKSLAQELAAKIKGELTKRREDRNVIDDFNVF